MYSEKVKGKRNANSAKKLQYWRMKTSELKFQKKVKNDETKFWSAVNFSHQLYWFVLKYVNLEQWSPDPFYCPSFKELRTGPRNGHFSWNAQLLICRIHPIFPIFIHLRRACCGRSLPLPSSANASLVLPCSLRVERHWHMGPTSDKWLILDYINDSKVSKVIAGTHGS